MSVLNPPDFTDFSTVNPPTDFTVPEFTVPPPTDFTVPGGTVTDFTVPPRTDFTFPPRTTDPHRTVSPPRTDFTSTDRTTTTGSFFTQIFWGSTDSSK